jgi:hypothetical protein
MFLFGDKECERHLDYLTPNNVRDHHDKEKVQIEYLQKWVIPLLEAYEQVNAGCADLLKGARENLKKWKTRIA